MEYSRRLRVLLGHSQFGFDLETTVCNHGFFMMAPNKWSSETKTLQRPLRLANGIDSVVVSISHAPENPHVDIYVQDVENLTDDDEEAIQKQVYRMLRIDEVSKLFHKKHEEAKEKRFCKLFRSASLFEDAVKSILLCNTIWSRSLAMAETLCEIQPELAEMRRRGRKRARIEANNAVANFPSARELAKVDEEFLKKRCNVGHRAKTIMGLVRAIESETLKIDDFENELRSISYEQIRSQVLKIKGIGPFTCANILMCIGHYIDIPIDSETIRLVKKIHGRENCSRSTIAKDVKEIYGRYEPYQCLAYWFDLVNEYESRYGKLSELSPSSYHMVSGHIDPKPAADKQV